MNKRRGGDRQWRPEDLRLALARLAPLCTCVRSTRQGPPRDRRRHTQPLNQRSESLMTLRHLRHLSSRVNARVAGPSPDVSVLKMRAAPYCASWLYFDVLGHGRYRLLFVWRSVIQMEAIPKEVNLEEYCLSFRTSSLGPLLKGLGVTNVTSPHTKSLWHFVAVLCLCRRERLPTLPSHPPLGCQPTVDRSTFLV
jgi:hypothetical protein